MARIIWIPKGLEATEQRQQAFVDALETDPDAQRGADVLRTDLGELKLCMQNILEQSPKAETDPAAEEVPAQVYVVYAADDFDGATALEDALYDLGCEVISPLLEGSDEETSLDHNESLRSCDAVILYQGNASDGWLRAKVREVTDVDQQRERPLKAKGVYLAGPETRQKSRFQTRRAVVMKHFDEFASEHLDVFMTAVKNS